MKKTVLIITHVQPVPANAGDSLRLNNLIRFFKEQEYRVVCLFKDWFSTEYIEDELNDLIDDVFFCKDYNSLITKFNKPYKILKIIQKNKIKACFDSLNMHVAVKQLYKQFKPTVVIAQYIFMAPYLKHIPEDVLKIIDTIDVFARKQEEVCKHGVEFPLACTEEEERKYLLNGNLILGIQPQETEMLQGIVPNRKVINVGVDMPCNISTNLPEKNGRTEKRILIVAGGNPNNVHGVNQFLRDSWSEISKADSGISLRIVGAVCKHIPKELVTDGVVLAGIVDDLSLEYKNADIVINPVVAGTGLKIKTIEAMSYGKPIISTPNGVEGVVVAGHDVLPFVVVEPNEFADKIIQLLQSEREIANLQRAVHEYTKKYLSASYVYKELEYELKHESN